jgi:hypothetical protein
MKRSTAVVAAIIAIGGMGIATNATAAVNEPCRNIHHGPCRVRTRTYTHPYTIVIQAPHNNYVWKCHKLIHVEDKTTACTHAEQRPG